MLETKKNITANENVNEMFTVGALIPDPVFFCSIEAPSAVRFIFKSISFHRNKF